MAIIDTKLQFCDATNLASATTSGVFLGNIIDLEAAGKDGWGNTLIEGIGEGGTIWLNINVNTVMSAHSCEVQLHTESAIAASSTFASSVKVVSAWLPASSPAGSRLSVGFPTGGTLRYVGLIFDASSNSLTGKVDAWLSNNPGDTQITTTAADIMK